jgi:flagellar motor switch protein FliN/FliY
MSATAPATLAPAERCLRLWADQLASVLGQMAGKTLRAAPFSAAATGNTAITVTHGGGRDGKFSGQLILQLSEADAVGLACLFTAENPGEPSARALSGDSQEALLELFRQSGGLVASALKPEFGEVKLEVALGSTPASPGTPGGTMQLLDGGDGLGTLSGFADEALVASLTATAAPARPAEAERPAGPANLDLLWGVHLGVVLRFGRRHMSLREILDFCAGTVIELDQQVEEPVDLLLDGRVIARGEVVVVEGNYGLRVTEIAAGAP